MTKMTLNTRAHVEALTTKQIAAIVAAARGKESFRPATKADALKAYEKTIGFAVEKPVDVISSHPGFDAKTFELTYDRRNPAHHAKLMRGFEKQARTIVDLWSKSGEAKVSGARLREMLETDRDKNFPGSKQREIVRIFQDYRKRLVDAGFVTVRSSHVAQF